MTILCYGDANEFVAASEAEGLHLDRATHAMLHKLLEPHR